MKQSCRVRINVKYKGNDTTWYLQPNDLTRMPQEKLKKTLVNMASVTAPEENRNNWVDG